MGRFVFFKKKTKFRSRLQIHLNNGQINELLQILSKERIFVEVVGIVVEDGELVDPVLDTMRNSNT